MEERYRTKDEVLAQADVIVGYSLRDIIPSAELDEIERAVTGYGNQRKGHLGGLVEWYVYGKKADSRPEPDFPIAGVELKTTPLKRDKKKKLLAKERLVFSMIDYASVGNETWDTSSFLRKNAFTLLLMYLYEQGRTILDHKFVAKYALDFVNGLTPHERAQIRADWEHIVAKVRNNEAHLLSEADTMYLAACTKGRNAQDVSAVRVGAIPAMRRAYSLKKGFMDRVIAREIAHTVDADEARLIESPIEEVTLEESVARRIAKYVGHSDKELAKKHEVGTTAKNWRQNLVRMLLTGRNAKRVEELEKADVTLKVITLEPSGVLKESISFPAFDYKSVASTPWYSPTGDDSIIADFHRQLDEKKFLFVVFQKVKGSDQSVLRGAFFWNMPQADISEAKRVYELTQRMINEGDYANLPGMADSTVVHVRPHGRNAADTAPTPQGGTQPKKSFWLNAKYIEAVVRSRLGL